MTTNEPIVSVIVPCYNSEDTIEETIQSVLDQTIRDIEVLVVDDASTDDSVSKIAALQNCDNRVILIQQEMNRGVAAARNRALENARGRYIAYLDSDDIWAPNKLERQMDYMDEEGAGACFTAYETIEEDGMHRNFVKVPNRIGYSSFLKNTITCSHTLMFDTAMIDKELLRMPDIRRGQDFATWLQVLKAGNEFVGLNEVLAKYRKSAGSLSSNKIKAIKRTWNVYRNIEHLSLPVAVYCQFWQVIHAVWKRRKD